MTVLLAGASGLVGREVARLWPATAPRALGDLHLLLRRPDESLARLGHGQTLVPDFAALPALPPCTAAICCLGTTIRAAGSQAAFRAVDHDAVLAFARAAQAAGATRLAVVSALGADAASRSFYNRTKGEAEAALRGLGLRRLTLARPSLLRGERAALAQAPRPAEALALALTRPVERWIPLAWRPITAETLARALIRSLMPRDAGVEVLESAELQTLGAP